MITPSHHHTRRLSYALTTFHPSVSHHPSGDEALKVERLKSKMTTNLDMARERVTDLCMLMGKCGCGPPGAQNLQFLPLPLPPFLLLPLLSLHSPPSHPPLHPSVSGGELRGNMGEKAPKAPKPTKSLQLISVTPREPLKHKKVQKQIH